MKYIVVSMMALALVVSTASANIYVNWQAAAGFYYTADGPLSGLMNPGESVLAQLIWTPTNTGGLTGVEGADEANVNNANYVSGDDVWLTDFIVSADDRPSGELGYFTDAPIYDDGGAITDPQNGYIYARIFESETPQAGDFYYVGTIDSAQNLDTSATPLPTAQGYQLNRDTGNQDPIDGTYGFQAVPEPGTIGLLALGLVTLGGAARKRRKTRA